MKKRLKRKQRKHLGIKKTRSMNKKEYISAILVMIMLIVGTCFIKAGWNLKNNVEPIYRYTIQRTCDYHVLLKPNTFYETETLPSGHYYAAKSVRDYQIYFQYDVKGSRPINLAYRYRIIAELVGTVNTNEDQGKEIWTRTYTLLEHNEEEQVEEESFSIQEAINLNYESYQTLVRSYEQTYGITIDAILKVRFLMNYTIDVSEFGIEVQNEEDVIELDIPITNSVTEGKQNYEPTMEKDIRPTVTTFSAGQILYVCGGGLCILGAIVIMVIRIRRRKQQTTPEEIYERKVNRVLKYYRDLIVTVTNEPNLSGLKVMEVMTLEDLMDVAEQTQSNILHYEVVKERESYFYVIVNDFAYQYKLI